LNEDYGEYYINQYFREISNDRRKIIASLVKNYNYNYKTLIDYIFRITENEGLALYYTIDYLRDYVEMQYTIKNGKYEKYPRFLHSVHDIVTKNYRMMKSVYDEIKFSNNVDKSLEYYGKDFMVLVPKSTQCLKDEGIKLNHCVGSYVERVINNTCQIAFLRQDENESLITLDIRNGQINQAKGYMNRRLTEEETKWLNKYCQAKNLKIKGDV